MTRMSFFLTVSVGCNKMSVVLVHVDGTYETRNEPQRMVANLLGGDITIVGAVPHLNVFAVSVKGAVAPENKLSTAFPDFFHEIACGTIAFIATDDDGDETTVDVIALLQTFDIAR